MFPSPVIWTAWYKGLKLMGAGPWCESSWDDGLGESG